MPSALRYPPDGKQDNCILMADRVSRKWRNPDADINIFNFPAQKKSAVSLQFSLICRAGKNYMACSFSYMPSEKNGHKDSF